MLFVLEPSALCFAKGIEIPLLIGGEGEAVLGTQDEKQVLVGRDGGIVKCLRHFTRYEGICISVDVDDGNGEVGDLLDGRDLLKIEFTKDARTKLNKRVE